MNCPFCGVQDTKVIDSRYLSDTKRIKRRRRCEACEKRFNTFECYDITMPLVIKRDGRREEYSRQKIIEGIQKSAQKRPVSTSQIEEIISEVEKQILDMNEKEVNSLSIGKIVMQFLFQLDQVAYVRFAAVYNTFDDINGFLQGLNSNS